MHGEFRYRRTDDDQQSDMCRIGREVAKQRRSVHHHVVWHWQNVVCESRGCPRVATGRDRIQSALHVFTRISCRLTEQPKVLFTWFDGVPLKVCYVFIMALDEKNQNRHDDRETRGPRS
jgi:hypothetical protein